MVQLILNYNRLNKLLSEQEDRIKYNLLLLTYILPQAEPFNLLKANSLFVKLSLGKDSPAIFFYRIKLQFYCCVLFCGDDFYTLFSQTLSMDKVYL